MLSIPNSSPQESTHLTLVMLRYLFEPHLEHTVSVSQSKQSSIGHFEHAKGLLVIIS